MIKISSIKLLPTLFNLPLEEKKALFSNHSSVKNILMGGRFLVSSIQHLGQESINKISELVNYLLQIKYNDSYKLVKSNHKIPSSEEAWHLNVALLKDAAAKTDNPLLKKQIRFLANNYLSKSASIYMQAIRLLSPKIDPMFQVGNYLHHSYHRFSFLHVNLSKSINKQLALQEKSPLILTETDQFSQFLPLSFQVLTPENENEWSKIIAERMSAHFSQYPSMQEALKNAHNPEFLLDLSTVLNHLIETKGKKANEAKFKIQLNLNKKKLEKAVEQAIQMLEKTDRRFQKIKTKNKLSQALERRTLKKFICKSTLSICRIKLEEMAGIKVLPLFTHLEGEHLWNKYPKLSEFIQYTGLHLGAINMRRHLLTKFEKVSAKYAPKGKEEILYFENKTDLLKKDLFKKMSKNFAKNHSENPELFILGDATLKLLKGLLKKEISTDKWQELNNNPAEREIVQSSLYKIQEQLAMAELHSHDFKKFAQNMELIHCELATLLELAQPFKKTDFSPIYLEELKKIPPNLKPLVRAGLGKTAMNVFAGINAALLQTNPKPVKAYSKDFYFEQAGFIGSDRTLEKILGDSSIETVDLYGTHFNPPIDISPSHTHYEAPDVVGDVKKLLEAKPKIKHLTVAIDCTIENFNSSHVDHLLASFEQEIKDGKLNFVFFRSGQKFDMLGMDNYYGSPFYIVNNGEPQWKAFDTLFNEEVHQTDTLSLQWFCLANRYTSKHLDLYREQIYKNAREILKNVPEKLKPNKTDRHQKIRVNTFDKKIDPTFIDIKISGPMHKLISIKLLGMFYQKFLEKNLKGHTRASFGFYHANCIIITANAKEGSTSIRLNPGLDPKENEVVIDYLKEVALQSGFIN